MELAEVLDPDLGAGWQAALAAVTGLQALVGKGVVGDDDVLALQINVEHLARRLGSLQLDLQAEIGRRGLHRRDGHASARVMARHRLRLSDAEAARRTAAVRALRDLPDVHAAFAGGAIGACQVNLIASVHSNPRIREQVPAQQGELLRLATTRSYRDFAREARKWERLVDTDGGFRANQRNHDRRDVQLTQDGIDLSWVLTGSFGAEQGARLWEILDRYIQAEWQADWADARARLGDAATTADLSRTEGQRRADALDRIFADAAGAPPGTKAPKVVHNIVWDATTYFGLLAEIEGAQRSSTTGGGEPAWYDPATYRCETINGTPLEPVEALASSLANHARRVVINTRGVVIDLGGPTRLFTGAARTAAQLQHTHCVWPGCQVPTTRCEIDHVVPRARGGGTNPTNGAPLCGFHNRWKQKGYTTTRSPNGHWHTHRPDGTEIT